MNRLSQDDIDADLWEIEQTTAQIKKIMNGEVDLDALDKKHKEILRKREQETLKKEIKARELYQKQLQGRQGHGEGNNYEYWCEKCFIEYTFTHITKCAVCDQQMMTKEERHKVLKIKVEALKAEKTKKKYKKMKYDNWMKSQGMIHVAVDRQGPTNYCKWDLYESESDEENKEPILPRHDPQFLALEKQLNDDMKKREESKRKALKSKDQGNTQLKEKDYDGAIKYYTEAIEEDRSTMSFYTNRAFAYMKNEEWSLACDDCNRVIDYYDLFEDEMKKYMDLYIKALTRKAVSLEKMKNYPEAKEFIEKAKEFIENDPEILRIEETIKKASSLYQQSLETMNVQKDEKMTKVEELLLSLRDIIKSGGDIATMGDFVKLFDAVLIIMEEKSKNKPNEENNYILFFTISGGVELLFSSFKIKECLTHVLKMIRVISDKYMQLINEQKGFNKLVHFLFADDRNNDTKNKDSTMLSIEQADIILEMLEKASLTEEIRKNLCEIKHLDTMTSVFLAKYNIANITENKTASLLSKAFTFICNICYSSQEIRSRISNKISSELFTQLEKYPDKYNPELDYHQNLLESILSFITNLACDIPFRTSLSKQSKFLKFLSNTLFIQLIKNELQMGKVDDIYEKITSLFYNISFISNLEKEIIAFFLEIHIEAFLFYYILHVFDIKKKDTILPLLRSIMLMFRIGKYCPTIFNKTFPEKEETIDALISFLNKKYFNVDKGIIDYSIKLFVFLTRSEENGIDFNKNKRLSKLVTQLDDVLIEDCGKDLSRIGQENNERIVNTLSLLIAIMNKFGEAATVETKPIIPIIIAICKDKTDLLRKNSAILLAKIAKSSQAMEDHVRDLHGMDVLVNVTKFLNL